MGFLRREVFSLRESVRSRPLVSKAAYAVTNAYMNWYGRLVGLSNRGEPTPGDVAVCLRFRDEARYLQEWIDYYELAGVKHFFLYNNNSTDGYSSVLTPFLDRGTVTLINWPNAPASPGAEEDCIHRAIGSYEWVGFIDADEFVVVKDGRSIPEFLSGFPDAPAVALHWVFYGSSLHRQRPALPVVESYLRRADAPNRHVKVFVRPDQVTQCRNSHSWFYRSARNAVNEHGQPVRGSLTNTPTADSAWINHYYCKSEEDYREKMQMRTTLDWMGMNFPSRALERLEEEFQKNNDVEDNASVKYKQMRTQISSNREGACRE